MFNYNKLPLSCQHQTAEHQMLHCDFWLCISEAELWAFMCRGEGWLISNPNTCPHQWRWYLCCREHLSPDGSHLSCGLQPLRLTEMMFAYIECWSFCLLWCTFHELNVLCALPVISHHVSFIGIVDAANVSCSQGMVWTCKTILARTRHLHFTMSVKHESNLLSEEKHC